MSTATCAFFSLFGMKCFVTAVLRAAALQPHIKQTKPANTLTFFYCMGNVPQARTRKLTLACLPPITDFSIRLVAGDKLK